VGDLNVLVAGGLSPTPVAGIVILDTGEKVPFCIGCGGEGSAIGSSEVESTGLWSQPTNRISWEIEE
jgi:type IV pilus assembly protein PilY1